MIKINIEPVDLIYQKNYDCAYWFIELFPNRIRLAAKFEADEPKDRDLPEGEWYRAKNCFDATIDKNMISGCEKFYAENAEAWGICIFINGSTDYKIYVKKEKCADEIVCEILSWKFNEPMINKIT